MLQCASCSNVTVWIRVCMAPMTQLPHLAVKLAARPRGTKPVREQLHTAVQQPPPGTASICSTWSIYTLKCRVKVRAVLLPSSGSRRLPPTNCHSGIPMVAQGMISASQAFVERLFSVCGLITLGRRNRMDKSLIMGRACRTTMNYRICCMSDLIVDCSVVNG